MIGILRSERGRAARLLLCLCAPAGIAVAEEMTLDGGKISGNLEGVDAKGAFLLRSPLSKQPLSVRGEVVRRIDFTGRGETPAHTTMVELPNGDRLPGEVTSYHDDRLELKTPYAGNLRLARQALSTIHFGLQSDRTVLSGIGPFQNWTPHEGWSVDDDELTSKAVGVARREVALPEAYRMRAHISWGGGQQGQQVQPNLQIFVGGNEGVSDNRPDCYMFSFGYAGLELKRQNSRGRTWNSIHAFNIRPEDFPGHAMDFEFRVNRAGAQPVLELLVDGESKGRFLDVSTSGPTGGGIAFRSNDSVEVRISKLEITSWDAKAEIFRTEERGNLTQDSVVYDKGQRTAGKLVSVDGGGRVVFESQAAGRMDLPAGVVSSLFLSNPERKPGGDAPFVVHLRGGGWLTGRLVPSTDGTLHLIHPYAGELPLARASISRIERNSPQSKK